MIHKLTAKVQKINPTLPTSARGFSNCFVIEPEDHATLERRGTVYTVFDISSSEEFDTALVSKVVGDVLHDSYYQSENISPVQSLEKSIVEVRDRVTKLTNESIRMKDSTVEFNILSGVLWGNVLYVVSYGDMASFLMRDGQIKPINANSEGHFTAASGVVKNDDVIVFSTKPFVDHISPDQLFDMSVQTGDLPLQASSLLLKIVIDTSFSDAEVVDFGMKEEPAKKPLKSSVSSALGSFSNLLKKKDRVEKKPEVVAPYAENGFAQPLHRKFELKLGKKYGKKEKVTSIIAIAGVLLLGSIFITAKNNNKKGDDVLPASSDASKVSDVFQDTPEAKTPEIDTSKDSESKISRISSEVLYDIKLVDPASNPTGIEVTDDSILVYDSGLKKTFASELATPKFVVSDKAYEDKGISASYLGNTYSLSGDTITKTTTTGEKSTWAQSSSLVDGKSIAIDMSIYVLKADGSLLKYLRGVQETFEIAGLDKGLSSPVQVIADYDFDNVYVADAGNQRIVILNKEGVVQKQIINSDLGVWSEIKGIAVTSDEKAIYVLSGSRVFKVDL